MLGHVQNPLQRERIEDVGSGFVKKRHCAEFSNRTWYSLSGSRGLVDGSHVEAHAQKAWMRQSRSSQTRTPLRRCSTLYLLRHWSKVGVLTTNQYAPMQNERDSNAIHGS